jgi:hypothetical protein
MNLQRQIVLSLFCSRYQFEEFVFLVVQKNVQGLILDHEKEKKL